MSEMANLQAKKPEVNIKNSASRIQNNKISQTPISSAEHILFLQRTIGNQAVQRLIKSGALQAKLAVNTPGDIYEQEVADAVMKMPEPYEVSSGTPGIQRACPKCENDELRRQPIKEEDEEELQAKAISGSTFEVNPDIESHIQSSKSGGQSLSETDRAFFEPRLGHDLSHVRMHSGRAAEQSAREVNANAYTVGHNIVFGGGQHAPSTHEGRRLIAHELTQVIQQSGPDRIHMEREAGQMEAMASVADSFGGFQANNQLPVSKSVQQHVIQRNNVPTNFGEFETTKFVEADDRGVEIVLKFTPDETKVDAKKIALSQSIKTTLPSGDAFAIDPNTAGRMVANNKSGAGYYIDTLAGTNNPLYGERNNLGQTQDLKDTPASANTTTNPVNLGVNTNYELGYCYKENPIDTNKKKQPASLWDKPRGGKNKGESKMFETAALAIEGTDKDKYYGSVKWGYKMEGTVSAPTVTKMDIVEASKGTPTANFIEPAKLWNIGKTAGTIKVTADPATVLNNTFGTENVAKDTKLKQLETVAWGNDPAIKAEVLNNGTGSGKIIYIKVSDVIDIGDGSPNKILPV